jgi:hypothetical protein
MPINAQGESREEFWTMEAIHIVFALLLCLLLYGFENAIHRLSQNRLRVKPIYAAAYRGGILYGLINLIVHGDVYEMLGASLIGFFIAMGLFKVEELVLRWTHLETQS